MHTFHATNSSRSRRAPRRSQQGLSLVEMMIGAVIGLIILAGATRLFVDHVQVNRRLMLEARLHQDLRAAADLMARSLRRAGYWQAALQASRDPTVSNPYRQIEPSTTVAGQATYSHSRDVEDGRVDRTEASGFRLSTDTLQMLIGGSWQSLTDPGVVRVTQLAVTPEELTVPLGHLCVPACLATDASCPRLHVRRYRIDLTGRATSDPLLTRELHTTVRVRNDDIGVARCPAG
jgi:type IV pilus assembly protein PilW